MANQAAVQSSNAASASALAPRQPHFPARAKRVIFLCMKGGPSHLDLFDHKPELIRRNGKLLSKDDKFGAKLLAPVQPLTQQAGQVCGCLIIFSLTWQNTLTTCV